MKIIKYNIYPDFYSKGLACWILERCDAYLPSTNTEMGTKVVQGDTVKVDGKTILNDAKKRTYIAFNKPRR